jgi:hypothetical protein
VQHEWLSVECKHRKSLLLWIADGMAQAVAAAKPDQLPIVVLHQARTPHGDDVVMVKLRDFTAWFGEV